MLLNEMNDEKKTAFLRLVELTMLADGTITKEESMYYKKICDSLDISPIEENKTNVKPETILNELKKISTRVEMRTIAFEIISLICIDHSINETETDIINLLQNSFCIEKEDIDDMFFFVKSLIDIEKDIEILINK